MKSLQLFLIITSLVLAAFEISGIQGISYCFDFNDSNDLWYDLYTSPQWVSTLYARAPVPIPDPASHYMWLENTVVHADAVLYSPQVTLNAGDVVRAAIYRDYVTQANLNNPLLAFHNDATGAETPLLWTYITSMWDDVSIICSVASPCCEAYPCTGRFFLHGQLDNSAEILAVDSVSVNDATCY